MTARIRDLDPVADLTAVAAFWRAAPDCRLMAEGACDPEERARAFFTDHPPGCAPADGDRLGLILDGRLSGVAELSFGFPETGDADPGLMVLGPWAQGAGHGRTLLAEVRRRARARGAPALYLGVLDANPCGRAFWLRAGFTPTGVRRHDAATGHWIERLVRRL